MPMTRASMLGGWKLGSGTKVRVASSGVSDFMRQMKALGSMSIIWRACSSSCWPDLRCLAWAARSATKSLMRSVSCCCSSGVDGAAVLFEGAAEGTGGGFDDGGDGVLFGGLVVVAVGPVAVVVVGGGELGMDGGLEELQGMGVAAGERRQSGFELERRG